MAVHAGLLFAATSAWHGGLQRSVDGGTTWQVVYEHPTPPGFVSRMTTLAFLGDTLYAGLSTLYEAGVRLLRWDGARLQPVSGWPPGHRVIALTAYQGWLYGVNIVAEGSALWRTNGEIVGYRFPCFAFSPLDSTSQLGRGVL